MKKIITLLLIASCIACSKQPSPQPSTPNSPSSPSSYTNTATLIYTSQWSDSTVFYWSNWNDPHYHNDVSTSTCPINHSFGISEIQSQQNQTSAGYPGSNVYNKNWSSTGSHTMIDTITIQWTSGTDSPKLFYYGDVTRYNTCSGFISNLNPWMTGSIMLYPDSTVRLTTKAFNYTTHQ